MMSLRPRRGPITAGEGTSLVPHRQPRAHRRGCRPAVAAHVEHAPFAAEHDGEDVGVAGHLTNEPGAVPERNYKPTGADLRDGKLLVATANGWLRHEADAALRGDELVKALASAPPKAHTYWEPDHALVATEAIAWTHPPLGDSFLSLSETGQFRWVREGER